jgi:broad specificity phosphatase PhoE
MYVYFMRHGESEGNMKMIRQGPEEPLSKRGIEEAKALAKRTKRIPAEVIFSSNYLRAQQTAAYIQDALGTNATSSLLFSELKQPSELVGFPIHGEESRRAHELKDLHEHEPDWHLSDEENFYDARNRAGEALKFLEELPFEHMIVVTHSHLMFYIVAHILLPETISPSAHRNFRDNMRIANGGITTCEFLRDEKRWRLICWNDHAHIKQGRRALK